MRWKCTCGYDGTDWFGWQSQAGGNAVQDMLEFRLGEIFKRPIRIHGSGRTDSGVHAYGQVFHFDGEWHHPVCKLLRALQTGLPASIQVTKVSRCSGDFHARFSAVGKQYLYRLYQGMAPPDENRYSWNLGNRSLDVARMQDAADRLLGTHDFSAFAASRRGDTAPNPVKTLSRLDVTQRGKRIRIVTEGSGYLYKMVRSLVGTLVQVGLGNLTPDRVQAILDSKQRTELVSTAPAHGLWLMKVFYSKLREK